MPTELQKLDAIHSRTSGLQRNLDVDSILHLHQTSSRRGKQLHWHQVITTSICVVTILSTIISHFRSCPRSKSFVICKLTRINIQIHRTPFPTRTAKHVTKTLTCYLR